MIDHLQQQHERQQNYVEQMAQLDAQDRECRAKWQRLAKEANIVAR